MSDGFNIDPEVAGFRKNHLDWRKFREAYNRVSATKLERGIKPLPFSLLLKLFGPQKVFNTVVISRRQTDDLDLQTAPLVPVGKVDEMNHGDMAVTNTLNFPGNGILNVTSEDRLEYSKGTKQLKRDALPVRPALQRNSRVPGRYFPKPSTSIEESLSLSVSSSEILRDRPRTQTPRSIHSNASNYNGRGPKGNSSKFYRNSGLARGPVCKATDTFSSNTSRATLRSGKSSATTVKSMPAINTNGYLSLKKNVPIENGTDKSSELYCLSFRAEDRDIVSAGNVEWDLPGNDARSDSNRVKRPQYSANRHVSFPKTSVDFSAVLQGRPKTLHRRELTESIEFAREPRARTHVGFADTVT